MDVIRHRLTTMREHTDFSNYIIDYILYSDDQAYYEELWFINQILMGYDICPLCYEVMGDGKPHGSWCK